MSTTKDFKINRTYKDRLFRFIFHNKEDLLELYNAINNTDYKDASQLVITTLEDAIYIGMKNDLSFLIKGILNLYGHQGTYNPNLPLRGLLYLADEYQAFVEKTEANIYGTKLIKLPAPRCIVFYNGTKEQEEQTELYLSDAFEVDGRKQDHCIEFKVVLLNINWGCNKKLMAKCKKLSEYSQFIAKVRDGLGRGISLSHAINEAVEYSIQNDILSDFLRKNRAEVFDLLLTEYDEVKHMEMERRDAKEEGRDEGRQLGKMDYIILKTKKKLDKGKSPDSIAYELDEDLGYINQIIHAINKIPIFDLQSVYDQLHL